MDILLNGMNKFIWNFEWPADFNWNATLNNFNITTSSYPMYEHEDVKCISIDFYQNAATCYDTNFYLNIMEKYLGSELQFKNYIEESIVVTLDVPYFIFRDHIYNFNDIFSYEKWEDWNFSLRIEDSDNDMSYHFIENGKKYMYALPKDIYSTTNPTKLFILSRGFVPAIQHDYHPFNKHVDWAWKGFYAGEKDGLDYRHMTKGKQLNLKVNFPLLRELEINFFLKDRNALFNDMELVDMNIDAWEILSKVVSNPLLSEIGKQELAFLIYFSFDSFHKENKIIKGLFKLKNGMLLYIPFIVLSYKPRIDIDKLII